MNQIDVTLREMPAADQPLVKAWLEKSYNRSDEIQEMVKRRRKGWKRKKAKEVKES